MKFFILFACLVFVVLGGSDSCDYVASNRYLKDPIAVRDCYNSYTLSSGAVETLLKLMEASKDVYVYKDLFKNPPVLEKGYATKLDYDAEVDEAKKQILASGNIASKVFRSFQSFAAKFQDHHIQALYTSTGASKYLFERIFALFPFAWSSEKGSNGEPIITACASQYTSFFDPSLGDKLNELYYKGEYVKTVDGKDAYSFFSNFLGKYNNMKSLQAKLFLSFYNSIFGSSMTGYPPDDDMFNEHTMVFSNGEEVKMNMTFVNNAAPSKDGEPDIKIPVKQREMPVSIDKEAEIAKNFKFNPNQKNVGATGLVICTPSTTMNYLAIAGFPPALVSDITLELIDCVKQFDNNSAPIVIDLRGNDGGYTLLTNTVQYLMMPNRALAGVSAIRKTTTTKRLSIDSGLMFDQRIMCPGCKIIDKTTAEAWWSETFEDDYGNGVKHTRTDKGTISFPEAIVQLNGYVMKNIRNPTDIIVVTDGYCFSACSYLVHSIAETGGAIIGGMGPYNPESEIFVHSQCPSKYVGLGTFLPEFIPDSQKYGIDLGVTYAESYPFPVNQSDLYPRDFVPGYIDLNLQLFSPTASLNDLLLSAVKTIKQYKTNCNPKNKKLVYVNNECKVDDPNALDVGYGCGDDGTWDKNKCVISTCKPGYAVDFSKNACVNYYCDPRILK